MKKLFVVVQSFTVSNTLQPINWSTPSFPIPHYLPEFAQITSTVSMMTSNYLILCRPLLLLPSIFPSIRVISNDLTLRIRWPKYWSFSISSSSEYSGLTSFRTDRFELLAVQGTFKYLLQHYSSKALILLHSVFFKNHVLFLSWQSLSVLVQVQTHISST